MFSRKALQYTPLPGIEEFLADAWTRAGSRSTMIAVNSSIAQWCIFLEKQGINSHLAIDDEVVSDFAKHLFGEGYKHGYVALSVRTAQRWLRWMREGSAASQSPHPVKIFVPPNVDVNLSGSDVTRVINAVREKYPPSDAAFSEILIVFSFCLQLTMHRMKSLSIRDVNNSACHVLVKQEIVPYGPPVQGSVARWLMYGKRRNRTKFLVGGSKNVHQAVRESGALVGIPLSLVTLRRAGMQCLTNGENPERFIPPVGGPRVRAEQILKRHPGPPQGKLDLTRLTRSEQHQVDF